MGAGGRMSAPSSGKKTETEALRRSPHEKPPFTIGDLKKAIPAHYFKKSLVSSFRYLIQDLLMTYALYYVATNYIDQYLPHPLNYLGWAAYIAVQGCVLTGAWVVGHECDHDALSNYKQYTERERKQIIVSDVAILVVIYGLYRLVLLKGFAWVSVFMEVHC